jgi:hypothetical protein
MPLCGFNPKMIQGVAIFAQGLFEAVLDRAKNENLEVPVAFEREIAELSVFLKALEDKYQDLRGERSPAVMTELVDWIAQRHQHGSTLPESGLPAEAQSSKL